MTTKQQKSAHDRVRKLIAQGATPAVAVATALKRSKLSQQMGVIEANILPRRDLHDGDRVIPLSDPTFFQSTLESLQRWVEVTRPSVLREHERTGGNSGEVIAVHDKGDEGIGVSLILTQKAYQEYQSGELRFVSPTIAWNFAADDYNPGLDNRWPAALLEVSLVSVPRFFIGQKPMLERVETPEEVSALPYPVNCSVGLNNRTTTMSQLSDATGKFEFKGVKMEVTLEQLEEMIKGIVDPLILRLEKLEAEQAASEMEEETEDAEATEGSDLPYDESMAEDEEKEEEDADASKVSSMSQDLRRAILTETKVLALTLALKVEKARRVVDADLATRTHLSHMSERMVHVYVQDKGLYDDLLKISNSATSSFSQRSNIVPEARKRPALDQFAEAAEISHKEGIPYTEAFERLNK